MRGTAVAAPWVVISIIAIGTLAHAQPAPEPEPERPNDGYIGRENTVLDIDDCRPVDPALTEDQRRRVAGEHYTRGETLYIQGDYEGAVKELVAAYCIVPVYTILKDIGQAYERNLEYEKAIGYLERYVAAIPPDAKRASQCAPDPQEDKGNVQRRVSVLRNLKSRVFVETTPSNARITIANDTVATRAESGQQIDILGGEYEMTVELAGYITVTKKIDVRIGKPYTYYVKLDPQRGMLSVQVTPPDARVFIDDRFVGIGRYQDRLPGGEYTIAAEAPERVRTVRKVQVLPNQTHRELVDLEPLPQVGRRQLIAAAAVGGGVAAGTLLTAFDETSLSGAGSVIGAAAGLVGAYFQVPGDLPLGQSNLTITSATFGAIAGFAGARVFTSRTDVVSPVGGASLLIGGVAGYYIGDRYRVRPGEAALFNSSILWGTAAGSLFAVSFNPPNDIAAGLVLSGLGMGGISGVLLTRYFSISRTHAVLIDIGGLIGIIGALAIESVVYPNKTVVEGESGRETERLANFALGGMAVGLVGAGILTRNLDVPKLPVQPALGTATGSDGKATTTYGFSGTF